MRGVRRSTIEAKEEEEESQYGVIWHDSDRGDEVDHFFIDFGGVDGSIDER